MQETVISQSEYDRLMERDESGEAVASGSSRQNFTVETED